MQKRKPLVVMRQVCVSQYVPLFLPTHFLKQWDENEKKYALKYHVVFFLVIIIIISGSCNSRSSVYKLIAPYVC